MSDVSAAASGCIPPQYDLKGPQVEPDSSYWNFCPQLRLVSIKELTAITDDPTHPGYFPPYPDPCTAEGKDLIQKEFEELQKLMELRDDPCALERPCDATSLGDAPCWFVPKLPFAFGCRQPISALLDLRPAPWGAVLADRPQGQQVIRTGRGLARAFENETPGLFHRHALNYLITTRQWSPTRQALVWAALDVALASALQAAWYYKWLSPRFLTSRRPRPIEYAIATGQKLDVLFDRPDELNPNYYLCPDARPCAGSGAISPGTPRHPAYPSGHSTYAGAGSTILEFFFGNDMTPRFLTGCATTSTIGQELRNLADNIGMARLWAGVHWRSDHEAGLKLGQVVACLVLRQLHSICGGMFDVCGPLPPMMIDQCDCAQSVPCSPDSPPKIEELKERAARCQEGCPPCGQSLEVDPRPCPPPRD